ncbi:unnamed protein product [marine sediment metagenome]|uniref:Uncharacterized protein n=1 Tax=marine sediment metagenome TaxID=412755 RepID=X1HDT4_9ZZZZ
MSRFHKILILLACLGLLATGYGLRVTSYELLPAAFAQTPPLQAIVTWQAHNFYPSNYSGKAAATLNSQVVVSVTVVQDNKILDLSDANFIWYVDGKFFNRGKGLSEIVFRINKLRGDEYFVRAVVSLGEGERVETSFTIPVLSQHTVIEVLHPNNIVLRGEQAVFQAVPYFFNVTSFDDFVFFWSIDNQDQQDQRGSRLVLNIGTSPSLIATDILISATVSNTLNPIESTKSNIRLTIL